MHSDLILASIVVILGATGTYLLLPHTHGARKPRNVHGTGAILAGVSLILLASFWSPSGEWTARLFFEVFALASIACAVLTITSSNPVHSALWFAAVVLATSGLFLQAGAQFLAAGTVIVYAGAIIVTFLFVIMLAQMEGRAAYDRAARMPFRATWTCFLLFLGVCWTLLGIDEKRLTPASTSGQIEARLPHGGELAADAKPGAKAAVQAVLDRAVRPTARLEHPGGQAKRHVAGLGETLYTDHLMVVELTGALLFVALIGAVAIAAPKPPIRPASLSTRAGV